MLRLCSTAAVTQKLKITKSKNGEALLRDYAYTRKTKFRAGYSFLSILRQFDRIIFVSGYSLQSLSPRCHEDAAFCEDKKSTFFSVRC